MKFILLLALVGCAVNVQVTAAAAINPFYGTYDAEGRYAAANAAPLSINAAANLAAAAPYPASADAMGKITSSDYAATRRRNKSKRSKSKARGRKSRGRSRVVSTQVLQA